eukprot:8968396-Lingulodinium_polyedra.AAC.1
MEGLSPEDHPEVMVSRWCTNWNGWYNRCLLCGFWADEAHLQSRGHRKRTDWAADGDISASPPREESSSRADDTSREWT